MKKLIEKKEKVTISVKFEVELLKQLDKYCNDNGYNRSEVLNVLAIKLLNNDIK